MVQIDRVVDPEHAQADSRTPASETTLVGRENELAVIGSTLDGAPAGGSALLIYGEPGTGKSALLNEAARSADERGIKVLRSTAVEAEARMPLAGLHQLLQPVLDDAHSPSEDHRKCLLEAFGARDESVEVFAVALATLHLLSDCAKAQSVAVLVDDAHWLDGATTEVLSFVARRLDLEPVALAVTCREGQEAPFRKAGWTDMHLTGLDPEAAGHLVDTLFPSLGRPVRKRLLELAVGNPLAILELPQVFGAVRDSGPHWVPLTTRLQEAFAARLYELPEATRWILLVAALDHEASLEEILAASARLAGQTLAVAELTPAEVARLVSIDGSVVRFRHPLVPSAIYHAASTAERYAAHAALADVLEPDPARSVWHRAACAIGPDETLAVQLEATAPRVRGLRGTDVALSALRRAAQLSSSADRRGARLLAAAELALELGRHDEVGDLLNESSGLPLGQRERRLTMCLGEFAQATGSSSAESLAKVGHQALAVGDTALGMNALVMAGTKCFWYDVDQSTRDLITAAADRLVDGPEFDSKRLLMYAQVDPAAGARRVVARLRATTPEDVVEACADPISAAEDLHMYGRALACIGDWRRSIGFQAAAIAALGRQDRLGLLSRSLAYQSVSGLVLGDWRLATRCADECLRLHGDAGGSLAGLLEVAADGTTGRARRSHEVATCLLVLGTVAAHRGDAERAETLIAEGERRGGWFGSSFCLASIQAARASLALASGEHVEAFQHLRRIFEAGDPASHWHVARWGTVIFDLADTARSSGSEVTALEALEAFSAPGDAPEYREAVAYAKAVLAEDDAEPQFREAFAVSTHSSSFFRARLELAFGLWLRRQRRRTDSREQLRAARNTFEALGATPWAERARSELRASGETSRRRVDWEPEQLSPQEVRIAELAAAGLSNREIGERMFLSPRTVGSHLYRIFPKLGVRSRAEIGHVMEMRPEQRLLQSPGLR